jgi:aryl-alcohol dehydrogenase-like predicted oxidoreductase
MKRRRIPDTDLEVSALCQGLGSFGTSIRGQEADGLYHAFRQAGGDFFDTAHCYSFWVEGGLGASERALGECLLRHGDRNRVVVATKGGQPDGGPSYPRPDRYISPQTVASDITESLQRLGLDRIDLYYLHRDDTRVPAGEIIEILNAQIARGRIRHLGASNWSIRRIAEANEHARARGLHGFAASQPQWNLAQPNANPPTSDPATRFLTDQDVEWHAEHALTVIPYSSTARGYFATGGRSAADAYDNPVSRARLQRAQELAELLGCSVNQVVLAYLMNHDFTVVPILGTLNVEHLKDAIGADDVKLSSEHVRWLRDG